MMKKKTYITPSLYSRKITISHYLLGESISKENEDGDGGFEAKRGGFDWGNPDGGDGDEDGI